MEIKKAVIPAAGLGTRLLPATYATPKEMLPVATKPTIQYIIEELLDAGIEEILIITGRGKNAIENHLDADYSFFGMLENNGKKNLLKELEFLKELEGKIHYIRQAKPTGLADAVYLSKSFVNNENFVVALGDTIIYSKNENNSLKELIDVHINKKASATILVEEVSWEDVSRYGILKCNNGKVEKLIEKPSVEIAKNELRSNLAIVGRYVFSPKIFDEIEKIGYGRGNEKQLTDAIAGLVNNDGNVFAVKMKNNYMRLDIGNPLSYAQAFFILSLDKINGFEDFVKKIMEGRE